MGIVAKRIETNPVNAPKSQIVFTPILQSLHMMVQPLLCSLHQTSYRMDAQHFTYRKHSLPSLFDCTPPQSTAEKNFV